MNFEDILNARDLPQIWVVNLFSIELFHLCFCYESALVSISLSGQILTASISDGLLIGSVLFLSPVSFHFVISSFMILEYTDEDLGLETLIPLRSDEDEFISWFPLLLSELGIP